ncbi:MAG: phosphotransferase [Mycobacterium sp.]|nr:phosphotransferase [Mycobacterium sp.]
MEFRGFSSAVLRTPEGDCVRIAHSAGALRGMEYGFRVSAVLACRLAEVEVPRAVGWCAPSAQYPFGAIRTTWIDGAPVSTATEAITVGRFLRDLRGIDPAAAPADVQRYGEWRQGRLDRAREGLRAVRPLVEPAVVERSAAAIEQLAADVVHVGERRIVHGDLWHGNMVDRDRRLVGVLDWEECGVGDPAADFAGLWYLGDEWAHAVLDVVDPAPSELARIDAWRIVRELDGAAWSQRHQDTKELQESAAKATHVARILD